MSRVPGGRLGGLINNSSSASLWRGWYLYTCQLWTLALVLLPVLWEDAMNGRHIKNLYHLSESCRTGQSVRSCPGPPRSRRQRAGVHGLQAGSVGTEVFSHCNFCSASCSAVELALKYPTAGRQDFAADTCWVLANGCSLQREAFESCFSSHPIHPDLLHWPVRNQEENADTFSYGQ